MVISIVSNQIPDKVKIPSFIVIIAAFVTIISFLMEAYTPALHAQLGVFIPLIVVNCIVLGRAEAFASKNKVIPAILDGAGMGLGFSIALTLLGSVRELLGSGKVFWHRYIRRKLWHVDIRISSRCIYRIRIPYCYY